MNADYITFDDDDDESHEEGEAKKKRQVNSVLKKVEQIRGDLLKTIIKFADMPRPIVQLVACMQCIKDKHNKKSMT